MSAIGWWLERLQDRRMAWLWRRQEARAAREWLNSPRRAQITRCSPHPNRRHNPKATAVIARGDLPEICNDCGVGIVTITRREEQ